MKATLKDLQLELWLRNRNAGLITWTTKDGREIPINEMTDTHLENAMKSTIEYKDKNSLENNIYIHRPTGELFI